MHEVKQPQRKQTTSANKQASLFFQPKLTINKPGDAYEQEADAVADKVMRMPESSPIQRKPFASSIIPLIQAKGGDSSTIASSVVTNQINATRGSGTSMNNSTRSFMESRFGTDFSNVKIHADNDAVKMSQDLNAEAFTIGRDIYFNSSKYQPESASGKHLLAHELTHTRQQGSAIHLKEKLNGDKNPSGKPNEPSSIEELNRAAYSKIMTEWFSADKIREAKARPLAKSYLASNPILINNKSEPIPLSAPSSLNTPRAEINTPRADTNTPNEMIEKRREDRVVDAIKSKMKLHKTGKGNNIEDWTFRWVDSDNVREKTLGEKSLDVAKWGLKETVDEVGKLAMARKSQIAKAAVKVTVEVIDGEIVAAALFASGAGEVIATALLVIGFLELLIELGEPVEKELSPEEQETEDIVNAVRSFLQHKQDAANEKKNFMKTPIIMPSERYPYRSKVILSEQ